MRGTFIEGAEAKTRRIRGRMFVPGEKVLNKNVSLNNDK